MADAAVKHDYHLVNPSPWPLIGSIAATVMALGLRHLDEGPVRPAEAHLVAVRDRAWPACSTPWSAGGATW